MEKQDVTINSEQIKNNKLEGYFEIDITDLLDRYLDNSNNNFDISSNQHLITTTTFNTILNPVNSSCPITHEEFILTDEVITYLEKINE